jgi:cellulose synthase/poly-beta-1,6-N-acetylglucosamine synthase-like glycosyltransferase
MANHREIIYTAITLCLTLGAFGLSIEHAASWVLSKDTTSAGLYAANALFLLFVTAFCYGNILYQLTRLGYYRRRQSHRPATFNPSPAAHMPSLSILIPSYKEEVRTIEQTVLSAALQAYPTKTVVLLLDDPVTNNTADLLHIKKTNKKIDDIHQNLHAQHMKYIKIYNQAWQNLQGATTDIAGENKRLAQAYRDLAAWLSRAARQYKVTDHTDKLFVDKVYTEPAACYARLAATIHMLEPAELLGHYSYLRDLFDVRISTFQRKAFARLSHEPNKAMNLNSYISLMGGSYDASLYPTTDQTRIALTIPDADYVITLDADSIISHTYAQTLINHMEAPGNGHIAVAQTPYSSIPGSSVIMERIAGATTDIQYIIHQGFTAFRSTYWVGANALLRKKALEDIAETIPGQPLVRQYIQDRTVIEDTESSIDLVKKGWSLYNYPERLAFSATPNDYGSLIIQRRRWANGGLIILPKLLKYLLVRPSLKKIPEGFMRVHYLVSIALVNISLVIMLFVPLEGIGFSIWVPLTALPYFYLYYRDLRSLGYNFVDWLRVYALNLLLVPINLGGVLKSLQQMVTRKKIPFGRTPKVDSRTAAPILYYTLTYGLVVYCLYLATVDIANGDYLYAALIGLNSIFLGYALIAMVGVTAVIGDIRASARQRVRAFRTLLKAALVWQKDE